MLKAAILLIAVWSLCVLLGCIIVFFAERIIDEGYSIETFLNREDFYYCLMPSLMGPLFSVVCIPCFDPDNPKFCFNLISGFILIILLSLVSLLYLNFVLDRDQSILIIKNMYLIFNVLGGFMAGIIFILAIPIHLIYYGVKSK